MGLVSQILGEEDALGHKNRTKSGLPVGPRFAGGAGKVQVSRGRGPVETRVQGFTLQGTDQPIINAGPT